MVAIRLDPDLERRLAGVAKRHRRTKSQVVRDALVRYLDGESLATEARRQSLRVSGTAAEREALRFVDHATDTGEAR